MISAKVIEDSISEEGIRLTTMQLCYPRFIHSEVMTHRVFSRNASSSRAIPVAKMIDQVRCNPAMPVHWGANQPGMQARKELEGQELFDAMNVWKKAANEAADTAEFMNKLGLHKQVANRILEPFQWIHVVMTSTEWANWDELRDHEDADPNIQRLARAMSVARNASTPQYLEPGEWHLPYVLDKERDQPIEILKKISAARCCRVSYLTHDGLDPSIEKDLELCERLAGSRPLHASPFEHQATPDFITNADEWTTEWCDPDLHGNFTGWIQHRKMLENDFLTK